MSFALQPIMGAPFSFMHWPNCKLAVISSVVGLGDELVIAAGPEGSEDYDVVAVVWGPGDLAAAVAAQHGMGNFLVNLGWPMANSTVKRTLANHPGDVALDNTTSYSVDNMNTMLRQYTGVSLTPDGNTVQFKFQPYNP